MSPVRLVSGRRRPLGKKVDVRAEREAGQKGSMSGRISDGRSGGT